MAANVNRPVVKEQKEADVNRKLQIYGIISAFQNGKVPSNEQIDVALNSFLASKALSNPPEKLSAEGKILVEDTREVIKQAKNLLLSKNEGNLLQDFIWQTTQFDPKSVSKPGAPVSKDTAQRDGDEALQGLRTLGTLLITNGQFRKLLKDASVLIRDIAGDAATNAADRLRPGEEDLSQLDQAAPDNTWHEKPDLSKDNLRKQAKNIYSGNPKQDVHDVATAGLQHGTHGAGVQSGAQPGMQPGYGPGVQSGAQPGMQPGYGAGVQSGVQPGMQPGYQGDGVSPAEVDRQAAQAAAKSVAQDKLDANTDDETRERIKQRNAEYRRKAKNYFNKKVPKERKDQIVFRLKKMILECQQHSDYMEAIQTLLRLAENYGRHGRTLGQGGASSAKDARSGFSAAEADLRTIVERFANGTSTEDLWSAIGQIYKDAEHDDELRNWFKHLDSYIRRCLLEQGYILEDDSSVEWDRIYDQGRYLLREKYRTHTDRVVDEIKFVAQQFDQDVQNKAFANAVQKLFNDLGNDQDGKPVFKPHLWKDLSEVIIPAVMENIAYVPIPRIEYSDPQFDAIIENLVLESDNFMPNILEVASENYFRWGRKKIANKHKNSMEIKVAGVQMDLRDVSFHIKRKSGFPTITDTGVADLILPGDGLSFKMKVSSADKKDRQNFFKVDKVDVDFKELKLKVTKSEHKLLFTLFKPLALKAIRPALQKATEMAIKDQFNKFDALLYDVKKEAEKVAVEAKSDPEQAPNIYKRYTSAFQKRVAQGKQQVREVTENKKFKLAITKEDSIFPNIDLPGGISTKATEYRELSRKGDKWESPVFSIGNSRQSVDIPHAPKIERKPHETAATNGRGATNGAGAGVTNGHNVSTLPTNGAGGLGANATNGLHEKVPITNTGAGLGQTGQIGQTGQTDAAAPALRI